MRANRAAIAIGLVTAAAACGGGGSGDDGGDDAADADPSRPDADPSADDGIAADHPGDVGLGADPRVIWFEDFEAGSVAAIAERYDQVQGMARMEVITDQPAGAGGTAALALTAGNGVDAVDLYKQLPDHEEWWVRWYVNYDADVPWHHSGMWFGGYNPGMPYPSPMAGYRPGGGDRFSISIEPVYEDGLGGGERFDYYNYWMRMHSHMPEPVNDNGTAYYGNGLVHRRDFTLDEGTWVCLEVHVRLNPSPDSGAGAVLEVWKQDALVMSFDDVGPLGYWIRDKFCTAAGDGAECTDYPAPFDTVLDLQFRSTADLALNAFWPQNYISDADEQGTLRFDQMVVATERIGCLR